MNTPPDSIRQLARRLLAMEAAIESAADAPMHEVVRVSEKLRIALTRFAGADGFEVLLRRALVLARAEVPSLQTVKVAGEGRLEGLEELLADAGNAEAATAVIAQLLGLLVTFIGEPLTVRMVREAWPNATLDGSANHGQFEKSEKTAKGLTSD